MFASIVQTAAVFAAIYIVMTVLAGYLFPLKFIQTATMVHERVSENFALGTMVFSVLLACFFVYSAYWYALGAVIVVGLLVQAMAEINESIWAKKRRRLITVERLTKKGVWFGTFDTVDQ